MPSNSNFINVADTTSLNNAIDGFNSNTDGGITTINIINSFVLDKNIHGINPSNTSSILIITGSLTNSNGNPTTYIDGSSTYRAFTSFNGNITIQNLILKDMSLSANDGTLGAGAVMYIGNTSSYHKAIAKFNPTVTFDTVQILNSMTKGGNAPNYETGGFGGYGGAPNHNSSDGKNGKEGSSIYGSNSGYFGTVGYGGPVIENHGNGTSGIGSGSNGGTGSQGLQSGYGAGSSAGGGGGGGGRGNWYKGGNGGSGGHGGSPGFGGGIGIGGSSGQNGSNDNNTDSGGDGGTGASVGAGAGFGGAIFVMSNANITFKSTNGIGLISGNTVAPGQAFSIPPYGKFGTDGSSAGNGMFFQGQGILKFTFSGPSTDTTNLYKIADDIADENGALNSGIIPSSAIIDDSITGPDGITVGGGHGGVWGLTQLNGEIHIQAKYLLSGPIEVTSGIMDLSQCTQFINTNNFNLNSSTLQVLPIDDNFLLVINNEHLNLISSIFNYSPHINDSTIYVNGKMTFYNSHLIYLPNGTNVELILNSLTIDGGTNNSVSTLKLNDSSMLIITEISSINGGKLMIEPATSNMTRIVISTPNADISFIEVEAGYHISSYQESNMTILDVTSITQEDIGIIGYMHVLDI